MFRAQGTDGQLRRRSAYSGIGASLVSETDKDQEQELVAEAEAEAEAERKQTEMVMETDMECVPPTPT